MVALESVGARIVGSPRDTVPVREYPMLTVGPASARFGRCCGECVAAATHLRAHRLVMAGNGFDPSLPL